MKKTALISVYDKKDIEKFAKGLIDAGWEILASGGTAKYLSARGISVKDVADLVGGEAILGHRVVTLSREIHAGLMARKGDKRDMSELEKLGIPFIDLVCVDLYPLEEAIAKPDVSFESVIEATDIGGPTMIRSAAKGGRIVICDPADRDRVVAEIKEMGEVGEEKRKELASKAEFTVAKYCLASARFHSGEKRNGMTGEQIAQTLYGENAYQVPGKLYSTGSADSLALDKFKVLTDMAPSYNNICDIDRMLQTITHIAAAFDVNGQDVKYMGVAVKHGNCCGAACGNDKIEVIKKMIEGDARAIFGGLATLNFEIDEAEAETILTHLMPGGQRRLLDGIIAPSFTEKAIGMMRRKKDKCRLIANPALTDLGKGSVDAAVRWRYVRGGFLTQPNYTFILDLKHPEIEILGDGNKYDQGDLLLAWAISAASNSNTTTLAKGGMLIGNGVGQQDRVGCCELAIKRAKDAGHSAEGSTAASDSFFPFPDAPEVLINAGVKTIFSTSGSVRDEETRKLCREKGVVLVQMPDKLARGFFGH